MQVPGKKFLVATLLIVAISLPMWSGFDRPGPLMEEGSLLVYPELVLKGDLPYRDFETFYGPANSLVLAGVYAVVGPGIFAERAVGLAYRILILIAFFVLIDRWNSTLAAGGTAIAALLMVSLGLEAVAWIGAIACALWSIWAVLKVGSPRRCLCGGFLAGLAVLFRPDLGPAIVASGLPFFLLMSPARRWNYLGGAALGLLPLLWLTVVAGPQQILNNLVLFPVLYCSPGRHLPISFAAGYLISMFVMHLVAVPTNILAGVLAMRSDRRNPDARVLLSLGLLGLGLTHQASQRLDFGHLLPAALLSMTVLPVSIFWLHSHWRSVPARPRHAVLAAGIVLILLQIIAPNFGINALNRTVDSLNGVAPYAVFLEHGGRSFPLHSPQAVSSLAAVLDRVDQHSAPGDRLFVGPADLRRTNSNETFIYYLLPRLRPATYFLEMNPESANRPNSRLASDVATADWLILTHAYDKWNEPNESMRFASEAPMRVIEANFQLCGRSGAYDLYHRRAPVALRN